MTHETYCSSPTVSYQYGFIMFAANDTLLMRSCAHTRLWKEAGHCLKAVGELNVNNDFVHIPENKNTFQSRWKTMFEYI